MVMIKTVVVVKIALITLWPSGQLHSVSSLFLSYTPERGKVPTSSCRARTPWPAAQTILASLYHLVTPLRSYLRSILLSEWIVKRCGGRVAAARIASISSETKEGDCAAR
ncbi:hypothetical protein L917_13049 [Phytophthora nicotianae]|uniref:Secreted protein n=1 Tax=Phytophthora nicotianae TaxID=4792 RepID=W2KRV2_PHYNI|nr:hypothetical protein L917_13049 [Phytophthora nicotianae]